MTPDRKTPFVVRLAGIFARSFVLTFVRCFILGWYVYFAVNWSASGGVYMYLIMLALSTFGLWQLIELLIKALKLSDKDERPEKAEA